MFAHSMSLIILAFAVSLDGFGVGVTYGLRRIRIPLLSVIIIAICSGLVIWLSMQAGEWISQYLSEQSTNITGAGILIVIGCWALYQLFRSGGKNSGAVEIDTVDAGNSTEVERDESLAVPVVMLELKWLGLVIQILRAPHAADIDKSGNISSSEAIMLGVALSLDAFGAGLGAAMLGFSAWLTALVITGASALFLVVGTKIGLRFSSWRGMKVLSFLPGILLIAIGLIRLL